MNTGLSPFPPLQCPCCPLKSVPSLVVFVMCAYACAHARTRRHAQPADTEHAELCDSVHRFKAESLGIGSLMRNPSLETDSHISQWSLQLSIRRRDFPHSCWHVALCYPCKGLVSAALLSRWQGRSLSCIENTGQQQVSWSSVSHNLSPPPFSYSVP